MDSDREVSRVWVDCEDDGVYDDADDEDSRYMANLAGDGYYDSNGENREDRNIANVTIAGKWLMMMITALIIRMKVMQKI